MSAPVLPAAWTSRAPAPEGMQVAEKIFVEQGTGIQATSAFDVILIHGFNVSHDDARFSYAIFRHLIEAQVDGPISWIEFHWPGNKDLGAISPVTYPGELKPADHSAEVLAEWIASQPVSKRFIIIAHSLGNRVMLQAIDALRTNGGLSRVLSVILMAPAVRVDAIKPTGLGPRAGDTWNSLVLYSSSDRVLQFAFPVGQTAAGDGFFPQAVGRGGQPSQAWSLCTSCDGYGHGDYWTGAGRAAKPKVQYLPSNLPLSTQLVASYITEGNNFSANRIANQLNPSIPLQLPSATIESHQLAEHETPSRATVAHVIASGTTAVI